MELLAAAFRDAVGGIVHSFAGGVYGKALVSLDELLGQDRALSRRWWPISSDRFTGIPYRRGKEWCLVHGDIQGGNVMIELAEKPNSDQRHREEYATRGVRRVRLIDYRSSGPGPRCIDAVALESSVRAADAEAIASGFGSGGASSLEGPDPLRAMQLAASHSRPRSRSINISGVSVRAALRRIGPSWTAMLYAIRQLAYPLSEVVRIRINAWLAAHYTLFRQITSGATPVAP